MFALNVQTSIMSQVLK